MARKYILEKLGFGLLAGLAVAIFLSTLIIPAAYADEITASCDDGGQYSNCHDYDHDGYYGYNRYGCPNGTDMDDTDPDIHPNPKEICNNGVDDNRDGKIDCMDSDCLNSTMCRARCTNYTSSQICGSYLCNWLPACIGPKISPYGHNTCLGEKFTGTYSNCSKACNATCVGSSDCPSKSIDSTCFFGGNCSDSCSCAYSSQVCPVAGTVINGTCYYGAYNVTSSCTASGCALRFANMSGNDLCNDTLGPQDTIGPVTSEVAVTPALNNGTFNITAVVTDTVSKINASEYFLSQGNDSKTCGVPGSGVAVITSHDNLAENVSAVSVKFGSQGVNKVCLHAQDTSGNFGNCTCANFEVDITSPAVEGNTSFNNASGVFEELVCNAPPALNMTFCDSRSGITLAEYFLDQSVPGYGLNIIRNYTNSAGWRCSGFSSRVNISSLADGVHNISSASATDSLGNKAIYEFGANYSFVKDSTPPSTNMVFSSESYWNCSLTEANGNNLSKCFFVLNGTQVMLNATDLGLDSSEKFAGNVTVYYRIWTKVNESENWTNTTEGVYLKNQTFDINLDNNTQYLFEFWSEDICGFIEEHKFGMIIAVVPVCPDAQCRFGENSTTCPSDCPSGDTKGPSSVSSSSSGSGTSHHYGIGQWVPVNKTNSTIESIPQCQPNWACGEWSECLDGITTRDCIDINNCTEGAIIPPELISQCTVEMIPSGVCGDGLCQSEYGETTVTCPIDCVTQESNTIENSPPTGNFLAAPVGLLSALMLLLIIGLASYLIYKRNKGMTKIKAKSIK